MTKCSKDLLFDEIRASIKRLEGRKKQLEDEKARPPGPKFDLGTRKDQAPSSHIPGSGGPQRGFRLPARIIPQMKYMWWHEFKNKLANEEEAYAIEVMVGGAKLYHQRAEEEKKDDVIGGIPGYGQRAERPMKLGHEACASEPSNPKEVPERIRINSTPLILIKQQIDPEAPWSAPTVIVCPYKFLVQYDPQLRERYRRLEVKWGACESGIVLGYGGPGVAKAADQFRDEAETSKPLDSHLRQKKGSLRKIGL